MTAWRKAETMNIATSAPATLVPTNHRRLRAALLIDAAVTGANGLAYVVAAAWLTTLLGPSVPFLIGVGVFLTSCAVVFLLVGRARSVPPAGVWFAIAVNATWALASVIHASSAGWLTPVGRVWTVLQGLVVLGFAVAQLICWRRVRP